jgi:hypothetical protein
VATGERGQGADSEDPEQNPGTTDSAAPGGGGAGRRAAGPAQNAKRSRRRKIAMDHRERAVERKGRQLCERMARHGSRHGHGLRADLPPG